MYTLTIKCPKGPNHPTPRKKVFELHTFSYNELCQKLPCLELTCSSSTLLKLVNTLMPLKIQVKICNMSAHGCKFVHYLVITNVRYQRIIALPLT